MGRSKETRNKESFLLAINDVCFLPQAVKVEIFAQAREYINKGIIPRTGWIADILCTKGYRECETNDDAKWTPGTYKIVKS